MYQYTDFDQQFVKLRAAQYRDQLERNLAGQLGDDEFRPLRLQNGWYIQRYAPMLRIAVPYGEMSSTQLRVLARIAREYDQPTAETLPRSAGKTGRARRGAAARRRPCGRPEGRLRPLHHPAERAVQLDSAGQERRRDGPAGQREHARHPDQRQLHPQHHHRRRWPASPWTRSPTRARSAKSCASGARCIPSSRSCRASSRSPSNGAREDRAAIGWYDIGLQLLRSDAGELGFKVLVGGGMGRTPVIGTVVREFLPWDAGPELPRSRGSASTTATAGATTSGRRASRSW